MIYHQTIQAVKTKEERKNKFLENAKKTHADKYDYSKVEYFNNCTKVEIICKYHNSFWQKPHTHLQGRGCPKCVINLSSWRGRNTVSKFISKAKKIHGDKYIYDLVKYVNNRTKIKIECRHHGIFETTPKDHLDKRNKRFSVCPKCNINEWKNNFIEKAKKVHGDKYDYSKVNYIDSKTKVEIVCKEHGSFFLKPSNHLIGIICPKCSGVLCDTDIFIEKAKKVHGDKYDYSEVEYTGSEDKIYIRCYKHGIFKMTPNSHINQEQGCSECSGNKKLTTETFIEKAKLVHGDTYSYSKVNYINNRIKVIIICKEHGEFLQNPKEHNRGRGCKLCNKSKSENKIEEILDTNIIIPGIKYIPQHTFNDCRGKIRPLPFDFYFPEYDVLLEYDGRHHFEIVFSEKGFLDMKRNDRKKNKYCKKTCKKLFRISYRMDIEKSMIEILNYLKYLPKINYWNNRFQ